MSRWPSGLKLQVPPTVLDIEPCDELVLRFEGRVAGPKGHANKKNCQDIGPQHSHEFSVSTLLNYFAICICFLLLNI